MKNIPKHTVPSVGQSFRVSKAALGLILVAFLLVGLLAFSTLSNINRGRVLMEDFLLQKGVVITRSIEAGTRTMMHHMGGGDPLQTLIEENSLEKDIVFIRIMDRQGKVLAQTGDETDLPLIENERRAIMENNSVLTRLNKKKGLFTLSKKFQFMKHNSKGPRMMRGRQQWMKDMFNWDELIISVGLLTTEFDLARKQDVRHSLFMGAILFLVGSAGFYFLFLYQGIRVARTTLANMKLYTENVIESMPAGLVTLDSNEKIVSCNQNTEDLLGKPFSALLGMPIHEVLPDCPFKSSEMCNNVIEYAMECSNDDGRVIPVKMSGSSLLDQDGHTIGTVLVLRDMSQIMEMEQQLERSRRMAALGKMAAGIAHEIRNPLGTLRGFAQFFGTRAGDDTESKGYADLMISEVDRLNQNISGLLQFARPREPQKVIVKVDDLIAKTVALMEGDFSSRKVNFHWECNTNTEFSADPDLLLQVLLNLLKNSIGATPEGGEVSLAAREDKGRVVVSVIDTGSGMTEQEQERMFDPFFTTKKTGTGLGLAVSHQIVEQHNGSFEVISAPDKGTEINIVLPNE